MSIKTKLFCTAIVTAGLPVLIYCQDAIKINPDNPKYFSFRGKPLALITASEHYGSVINRPFDFERYLTDAAEHKITLTRTFLLFRELQSARNPSSPCKPESPDYIAPWPRTGPGKAMDGEPVFDLDQWNPEYFERLHRFLDSASRKGIIVELTVFSNTYADRIWALNPLRAENNKQHSGPGEWQAYNTLTDAELVRRQSEYARKIVDETSQYDNVYYEICNEPGGGVTGHATSADVDAWEKEITRVIRDELTKLNRPHLIAGAQAFHYGPPLTLPLDESFSGQLYDIVTDHPLPDTQLRGKIYQMGHFMSKELQLSQVAEFSQAAYAEKKPIVLDEDNTASIYRDTTGWTIHRKRAWTALLNGAHYDYIDFSITVGSEAGTAQSRREIRSWMQHLSEFMSSFDYVHSKLSTEWVKGYPAQVVASGLAAADRDYAVYLADAREVTDASAGQPIDTTLTVSLPPGNFLVSLYSPVTGEYSPAIEIHGGEPRKLTLPAFTQDVVIRATRKAM
jgi:hypothetical protein